MSAYLSAKDCLSLANSAPLPAQAVAAQAPPEPPRRALDELLVERRLVSLDTLETARRVQEATGARLGAILVMSGRLSEPALHTVLAHQLDAPPISLDDLPGDDGAQRLVPAAFADARQSVPFLYSVTLRTLKVAFVAPTERRVIDYEMEFRVQVEPYCATRDEVKRYAYFLYNWNMYKRTDLAHAGASEARMRVGDKLLSLELITNRDLGDALKAQAVTGQRLGTMLLRSGRLSEEALFVVLNEPLKVPLVSLTAARADHDAAERLPLAMSEEHDCVPFLFADGTLCVAFAEHPSERRLLELEVRCGSHIKPFVATPSDIELFRYVIYDDAKRPTSDAGKALKAAGESKPFVTSPKPPSTPAEQERTEPKPTRAVRRRRRGTGEASYAHV